MCSQGECGWTIPGSPEPLLTDTGLLNGRARTPVAEIVQLTTLAVLALSVVPAVVTHTSMGPLARGKHSWVEVTGLRVPVAVTPWKTRFPGLTHRAALLPSTKHVPH